MDHKHRVLIVSGRLLMAQGLASLLGDMPEVAHVEIAESLYAALIGARQTPPDVMVVDMPSGADFFVDRPMQVNGREVKTIVLQEDADSGRAMLYVHTPGRPADLEALSLAICEGEARVVMGGGHKPRLADLIDASPAIPVEPQPSSLISASASGPSRSRMPASKPGA